MNQFRIGCYIRVSTEEQRKEGFSIQAQQRTLEAWTIIKEATSVEYYIDEGLSAKNMRRPQLQRLLADCRAGNLDAVLVWRLDRLTRNLRDLVVTVEDVFNPHQIQLISATESIDTSTPSGRLMLNILGSFAQNERENTAQRVRMVMTEIAKEGNHHMGGIPLYGYVCIDKKYVIEPREAEAVRMIFEMKAAGEGYGAIIDALTAAGHRTRAGKPFSKNTIGEMLRNPRYKGLYVYNRIENYRAGGVRNNHASKPIEEIIQIPDGNPAIISAELWDRVNRSMQDNHRIGGQNHAKNVYLISGLAVCGKCGELMPIKNAGRDRHGGYYRSYKCPVCGQAIPYLEADALTVKFLAHVTKNPVMIDHATKIANDYLAMQADDSAADLQPLYDARDAIRKKQRNVMEYIAAVGAAADPAFAEESRRLNDQLQPVLKKIAALEQRIHRIDAAEIKKRIKALTDIESMDPRRQRTVIRRIVYQVLVYPEKLDIRLVAGERQPDPPSPPSPSAPPSDRADLDPVPHSDLRHADAGASPPSSDAHTDQMSTTTDRNAFFGQCVTNLSTTDPLPADESPSRVVDFIEFTIQRTK